jgi:hypothetical protein
MKLKNSIYRTNTDFLKKFQNCHPKILKKGDYLELKYISKEEKRRGGRHLRFGTRTVLLIKKKRRSNSMSIIISSLYGHEKVKWRYLVTSPLMISILFVKKSFKTCLN